MSVTTLAGTTVQLDEDGHLAKPELWREEMAVELAARAGIQELTDEHWRVIRFVRQRYLNDERPPSCRIIAKHCDITGQELFRLFPRRRPVTLAANIAGVPAPRTYFGGCGVNSLSRWR